MNESKFKYTDKEIENFAKILSDCSYELTNALCLSEEVSHTDIGRVIANYTGDDKSNLIYKISKKFASTVNDRSTPDLEVACVQDACSIIEQVVNCCEEHNWFQED